MLLIVILSILAALFLLSAVGLMMWKEAAPIRERVARLKERGF